MPRYTIKATYVSKDNKNTILDRIKKLLASLNIHNLKIIKEAEYRTIQQNKSLHKYLTLLAIALTEAGYTQKMVLEIFKEVELSPTMYSLKGIFRSIGRAMFGKKSTKDLLTTEMQEVYKNFDLKLAETTGITVAWPSKDHLLEHYEDMELKESKLTA